MLVSPQPVTAPTFDAVYRDQVRFVWRTVRRLGVAEADVEDVSQQVFVVVHRRLPTFRGESKLTTWLFGILVRVVSDYRRSSYQRRRSDQPVPEVAVGGEPHDQLDEARRRALLDRLLDELDEEKRTVFVLCALEGMSVKDAAECMGAPLQTTYSRLTAARTRLTQRAAELENMGPA